MSLVVLVPLVVVEILLYQASIQVDQYYFIFLILLLVSLLIICINIIAIIRLIKAKRNDAMRKEVLLFGIYLLFGGMIFCGIFGKLASLSKAIYDDNESTIIL